MRRWRIALVVAGLALGRGARCQPPERAPARPAARIAGTVRDSLAGNAPLAGAHVQLVTADRPHDVVRSADSDALGRFVLDSVPAGRYLIGFLHAALDSLGIEPTLRAVTVTGDESLTVDLATPAAARLRPVRVAARRTALEESGFEARRRSGAGRYLTADDVRRRHAVATSDVFSSVPGMRVDRTTLGDRRVTIRGTLGRCAPAVFIDGRDVGALSADEIDALVDPEDVAGIEIYGGAGAPPELQGGTCGTVALWTKPSRSPVRHWSRRRRALQGAAALLLGAAIGALLALR